MISTADAQQSPAPPTAQAEAAGTRISEDAALLPGYNEVLGWLKKAAVGRYMVSGAKCIPESSSGWEGYQTLPMGALQRCSYSVKSCVGLSSEQRGICEAHRSLLDPKTAVVVLLEPGFPRLARWIVSACREAGGNQLKCQRVMFDAGQNGGNWQIPVAGIVYEDMKSSFYVQAAYAYRDGLTVWADQECGVINGAFDRPSPGPRRDVACSRPSAQPRGVSTMARPVLTTRGEVVALQPSLATSLPPQPPAYPVVGAAAEPWREFVRSTLVQAFSADTNVLLTAKALALHRSGAF